MRCSECDRLTAERDRLHRAFLTLRKLLDDTDGITLVGTLIGRDTDVRRRLQDALMELNLAQAQLTDHRDEHDLITQ